VSWSLSRFDYAIGFGGASHVGNVRQSNQDAWRADPSAGLFAVADGMGDTADGALAASVSLDHCFARLRASDALAICDRHLQAPTLETRAAVLQLLESCVREADETVKSVSRRPRHPSAPGCTLELLLLLGRHGFIVHVGHSRVYLVRPQATIQITSDHTVQNSLLAVGVGTISEPPPARPALTSVLGRSERLSVDPAFVELTPGDRLVLCTDGVHDELDSERELGELARRGTPEEAAVVLINAALSRAGGDNATAIVVGVGEERLRRESSDGGLAARDFAYARHCPLLSGLSDQLAAQALQSAIEVTFNRGEPLPAVVASDRVGYIVLEGSVVTPEGWTLGPSALLYPESLAGGGRGQALCQALEHTRAYRIRADDLNEVCSHDVRLAASIFQRLARNLARMRR